MPGLKKEKIFGWIELTSEFREWMRDQYLNHNKVRYAGGWIIVPAHHRRNPNRDIAMLGYPDVSESHIYHFDDPGKRDENNDISHDPLPIKSERDKQYFREENEKLRPKEGFYRYKILQSRKNLISEFIADDGVEAGMETVKKHLYADAVSVPHETKSFISHQDGGLSKEVITEAKKIVASIFTNLGTYQISFQVYLFPFPVHCVHVLL